jgi:hypothetical protein
MFVVSAVWPVLPAFATSLCQASSALKSPLGAEANFKGSLGADFGLDEYNYIINN